MPDQTNPSGAPTQFPAQWLSRWLKPTDRPADVVAFEDSVVTFFVDAAGMLSVPKSVAAIYGICFASAQPLSAPDIAARLEISAGSISQGLRMLREVGALKLAKVEDFIKFPTPGARNPDYYVPDVELRKLAERFIEERLEKQLKVGKARLESIKATVPESDPAAAKELKSRMKYIQSWHEKTRALMPVVKTFLKLT